MRIYISGGCKNGKSTFAEKIAFLQKKENSHPYYIATMLPYDDEDKNRIKKHIEDRAKYNFETIEIPKDIINLKQKVDFEGSFLLDSVTALLTNEMFIQNDINFEAHKKIVDELEELLEEIENIVIVSDYIYADCIKYNNTTEKFREMLAYIDKKCALKSDVLIEVCYNSFIIHKGEKEFKKIYEKLI